MALLEPAIVEQDLLMLSYLDALFLTNAELETDIIRCREYHEGSQNAQLTARLLQFLGDEQFHSFEFRLNVCRIIISAVTEKLAVLGFDSKDPKAIQFARGTWDANKMDAVQTDVYEAALRDSEHFVIVDWPANEVNPRQYARWLPQPRYTDLANGGDGFGCVLVYPNNDINLEPTCGIKQWTEWPEGVIGTNSADAVQRRTLYYDDRIEKYSRRGQYGNWAKTSDVGDAAWPLPWVDSDGKPLGVPVVHFKNKGLTFEAEDGIPMQDAINKSVIDLLTTSDQTAFRVYKAIGFIPTSDGQDLKSDMSNALEIAPGVVVGTTKSKQEADFAAIDPPTLDPLMNLVQQGIMWLALVTDTPVSRFITTKLIASDETLKEQEAPLIAKTENRQAIFGPAWTKCLQISWKLALMNNPPDVEVPAALPVYKPIWKDARGIQERLKELESKQKLRIPDEQIWAELGYSQDKIVEWKAAADKKAADEKALVESRMNATTPKPPTNAASDISSNATK